MPLTQIPSSMLTADAQYTGFKNRIINGRMEVSQRNGTSSVNVTGTSYPYQMDRFYCGGLNGVTTPFTLQQVSDAPAGFSNSVKVTVANTDALSNAATEYGFQQTIEASNTTDFNLGTANAVAVMLSFWVKSSLTGTFGVGIRNAPSFNRTYVGTYTINAANTWEQKSITLTLDTTGTWTASGNTASMNISWSLGVGTNLRGTANTWQAGGAVQTSGAVNLVSNAAATWQITGVQLEKGSTATSFDYRPYGTELALCQRYYEVYYSDSLAQPAIGFSTGYAGAYPWFWQFKQEKRAQATVAKVTGTWNGTTPTLYGGISNMQAYSSGIFYLATTAGQVAFSASAEL